MSTSHNSHATASSGSGRETTGAHLNGVERQGLLLFILIILWQSIHNLGKGQVTSGIWARQRKACEQGAGASQPVVCMSCGCADAA